jgi:hypothetical protein
MVAGASWWPAGLVPAGHHRFGGCGLHTTFTEVASVRHLGGLNWGYLIGEGR